MLSLISRWSNIMILIFPGGWPGITSDWSQRWQCIVSGRVTKGAHCTPDLEKNGEPCKALPDFTMSTRQIVVYSVLGPVGLWRGYAPVLVSEVTMYCVEEGSGATAGSQVPGQKGLELSSVNYRVTTLHYTVHYTPSRQCAIFLFILSGSRGFMFI